MKIKEIHNYKVKLATKYGEVFNFLTNDDTEKIIDTFEKMKFRVCIEDENGELIYGSR